MNKYTLTKDYNIPFYKATNKKLYRIKALKSFNNVAEGDLGGFIESEKNLSQAGTAWVYDEAKVYGEARVYGKALVCNKAKVYGEAVVCGKARVYGKAIVYGKTLIFTNT